MKKLTFLFLFALMSEIVYGQWIQSGQTISTNSNEVILNNGSNATSTLWLNPKDKGPGTPGRYYIRAFDWWGATLHFVGTGDHGDERLNVTFDGKVGIGTTTPSYILDINGQAKSRQLLIDFPNVTSDWNKEWQCGFFDGFNNISSPEPNQWFWGINLGHRSNNADYRYGGQIAILNSSNNPTMYFRSRSQDGTGLWTKVLHSRGDQRINGSLTVDGVFKSEEVKVEVIAARDINLNGTLAANNITLTANGQTADFVFDSSYQLRDLQEVEAFIKKNKHLPEIPSAKEMESNGVNLAEMNKLLLQKIEELTLYSIEQEKARQSESEARKALEERLAKLEQLLLKE